MDENATARDPEDYTAKIWSLSKPNDGHGHEDRPDPLTKPYEPTQGELGLLHSQVPGHRWNGWRRLTGDEDYYASCSCGWRSTDTGGLSPMLRQVQDHLDAVRAVRGLRPAPQTAQTPGQTGHETNPSQHDLREQRARELYAAVESQQTRLSQALEHSTDLLSASEEQADRLVAALQHAAANVAPPRATEASVRRAQVLQCQAEHAKQVRDQIVAAAGALAAIAEEVAMLHQHRETRRSSEYYLGLARGGYVVALQRAMQQADGKRIAGTCDVYLVDSDGINVHFAGGSVRIGAIPPSRYHHPAGAHRAGGRGRRRRRVTAEAEGWPGIRIAGPDDAAALHELTGRAFGRTGSCTVRAPGRQ